MRDAVILIFGLGISLICLAWSLLCVFAPQKAIRLNAKTSSLVQSLLLIELKYGSIGFMES